MTTKRFVSALVLGSLVGLPAVLSPGLGVVAALCAITYILWLRSR